MNMTANLKLAYAFQEKTDSIAGTLSIRTTHKPSSYADTTNCVCFWKNL